MAAAAGGAQRWGPVAELSRALDALAPAPRRWPAEAEELGGLWGLPGPDWPPALPPVRRRPELTVWQRLAASLRDRWPFPPRRPRRLGRRELAALLARCHGWLGGRILARLTPLFAPFWDAVPATAVAVSQKGLAWTLAAFALDRRGPAALERDPQMLPVRYRLTGEDPLGDFLCLHLHFERLVEKACAEVGTELPADAGDRQPGGLRRAGILCAYRALDAADGGRAREWQRAIRWLVAASPLTRLVYFDVLAADPAADEAGPNAVEPEPTASSAFGGLVRLGPERETWHELWISHLGRSLVGGWRSPPPSHERWVDAHLELERRRRAAERWVRRGAFWGRQRRVGDHSGFHKAQWHEGQVRGRMRRESLERLVFLARLFVPPPGDGRGEGARQALSLLHLRALDMLVRHLVNRASAEMKSRWRSSGRAQQPSALARDDLFLEGGVCFEAFVQLMFGCDLDEVRRRGSADPAGHRPGDAGYPRRLPQLGEPLADLLSPLLAENDDGNGSAATAGAAAGVSEQAVRELLRRFVDSGVELPLPPPHHDGHPPAVICAEWYRLLLANLPLAEA